MNKKVISFVLASVCALSVCTTPVLADDELQYPEIVSEISEQKNQSIDVLSKGIYAVGDTVIIDYEQAKVKLDSSDQDSDISLYADVKPSLDSVWDWGNGSYSGRFSFDHKVYTNYRFTGYSNYYVEATVTYDEPAHMNNGKFWVSTVQDDNGFGVVYAATGGYANIVFTGCKAYERLAFAVEKEWDGFNATGRIKVSH